MRQCRPRLPYRVRVPPIAWSFVMKIPKVSDDTPEEESIYDERCAQISREMLFLVSKIAILRIIPETSFSFRKCEMQVP